MDWARPCFHWRPSRQSPSRRQVYHGDWSGPAIAPPISTYYQGHFSARQDMVRSLGKQVPLLHPSHNITLTQTHEPCVRGTGLRVIGPPPLVVEVGGVDEGTVERPFRACPRRVVEEGFARITNFDLSMGRIFQDIAKLGGGAGSERVTTYRDM